MNSPYDRNRIPKDPFSEIYNRTETRKKGWFVFWGIVRFVLLVCIGLGFGAAGVVMQSYFYFTSNLPGIDKLKNYSPPIVTHVYADKGELIGEYATERRFVVPADQIPKRLKEAFIAAEDKNFWQHPGWDVEAIIRAVKKRIVEGKIEGASTITQQVAKTFLLTPERKFRRKIQEIILAKRIEESFSKEEILYLYLNQIFFGSGAHGVEAAAQTYFDKSVKDLTIGECAILAACPRHLRLTRPKRI